jgi:hypothetical protein
MKTFQQFQESIDQRRQQLAQKQKDAADSFKSRAKQYTADLQAKRDAEEDRKRIKDEIKQELANEVYDPEVQGRSQIRKTGEGGKIGAERKKTPAEMRRKKAIGGGKFAPAAPYKPRKDIGQQRQASTRTQQPEQERGSAREKQLAAAKAERKKAAQARIAAKKAGGTATAAKPKAKEAEKTATKLLSKKKAASAPAPGYKAPKASGLSRKERTAVRKKGKALLRDLVLQSTGKKKEKDLKHSYTGPEKE